MENNIKRILTKGRSPYILKIYENFIDECAEEFKNQTLPVGDFIIEKIKLLLLINKEREQNFKNYKKDYEALSVGQDKKDILLFIAKKLGSKGVELQEDEAALSRHLDFEALEERFETQRANINKKICFLISQIKYCDALNSLNLNILFEVFLKNELACSCIEVFAEIAHLNLDCNDKILQIAAGKVNSSHIWIASNSYKILSILNMEQFKRHFTECFKTSNRSFKDAIFLKSAIIEHLKVIQPDLELMRIAAEDSSAYVRQSVCKYLETLGDIEESAKILELLKDLILKDPDLAVRISALLATYSTVVKNKDADFFLNLAGELIILKVSLTDEKLLAVLIELIKKIPSDLQYNVQKLQNILLKIFSIECSALLKLKAQDVLLEISVLNNEKLRVLKLKLENIIKNIPLSGSIIITDSDINALMLEDIGKILYLIASDDFDIEFWEKQDNYVIKRSTAKSAKPWRILYELLTPGAEKRQDFSHIIAKNYKGENLVLSVMSELSPSGIPGEPVYLPLEGSRRFVPPIDYILAILKNKRERYLFSSSGITVVTPPVNFINKLYAYFKLTFKFKYFSDLRNSTSSGNIYISKLKDIGIEIRFKEWENIKCNDKAKSFFSNLSIFPIFLHFNIFDYFESPNENNIASLIIFIILIISLLGCRRILKHKAYLKYRKLLPLVIGGWGTRGKTSTERLKAGLLADLGFKVVSKTTGCRAALLISDPHNKLHELPIIRAGNLSNILEQKNCMIFASKFKSEIFLWECMGLKSYYAKILQYDWMRDDISTITNTYPDHEDLQGPTGEDVANSLAEFIYTKSTVLTAENIMLPVLKERAKNTDTQLKNLTCIEGQLITQDILDLFQCREHPNNIALVLLLAKELGINENIALKSMIDNSVPDIGALKYFKAFKQDLKEIHFINGMSANEVVTTLDNLHTLKLDNITLEQNPGVYVSALINNRFDRQKRSIEFAKLVAKHLMMDKFYLIGTNLSGFKKAILKAWTKHLTGLVNELKINPSLKIFENEVIRLKIPVSESEVLNAQNALIINDPNDDHIIKLKNSIALDYEKFKKLKHKVVGNEYFEKDLYEFFTDIFLRKIIIIEDEKSSPDEILRIILNSTPHGITNKVIGMQNIKSPGCEFIESWYDYEKCIAICDRIKNTGEPVEALKELAAFPYFNLLCKPLVHDIISRFKKDSIPQGIQDLINQIKLILEKPEGSPANQTQYNFYNFFTKLKQDRQNLKSAKQIYTDLANQRICISKAKSELLKISQSL